MGTPGQRWGATSQASELEPHGWREARCRGEEPEKEEWPWPKEVDLLDCALGCGVASGSPSLTDPQVPFHSRCVPSMLALTQLS